MTKALVYPGYFAHQLRYAHRSNYSGPRNRKALYLAVHTVQGSYSSCINWFQNSSANVSAHYVVSAGGHTTQMVGENMMAWHIGNHNIYTIGIEHEGYAHDGHPPTNAMYHASAKLAAGICRRHGIPVSRILGHRDFRGQSHTDPGNEWNMSKYRSLVKRYLNPKNGGGEKPPKPGTLKRMSRYRWLQDNSAPAPVMLTYEGKDEWRVTRVYSNPRELPEMSRWQWGQDNSAPAPVVLTYRGKPAWKVERLG